MRQPTQLRQLIERCRQFVRDLGGQDRRIDAQQMQDELAALRQENLALEKLLGEEQAKRREAEAARDAVDATAYALVPHTTTMLPVSPEPADKPHVSLGFLPQPEPLNIGTYRRTYVAPSETVGFGQNEPGGKRRGLAGDARRLSRRRYDATMAACAQVGYADGRKAPTNETLREL